MTTTTATAKVHRKAPLATQTDLGLNAVRDISGALTTLLADMFALYLKTKNFHWHVSGPHFRDYHLMLDEQGDQIFATTDQLAERVRKIGGTTLEWPRIIAVKWACRGWADADCADTSP
jgi:starvation-inducible DNA-binding protein